MGEGTKIEWADHTFNPWWGCVEVSPGCAHCYAKTWAVRSGENLWGARGGRRVTSPNNWRQPLKWNRDAERAGTPAFVFCASMADVFEDHPAVIDARKQLWDLIDATPWLTWLLLTKRPENVRGMVPWEADWPRNIWLGTSVEDEQRARSRAGALCRFEGPYRKFLSVEPLLGEVDLGPYLETFEPGSFEPAIDWVIAGGESGAKARPMHPDWVRRVRDDCVWAGVAFLLKQWGNWRYAIECEDRQVEQDMREAGTLAQWERYHVDSVMPDGTHGRDLVPTVGRSASMMNVGKKLAGRELDGRTWDERPAPWVPA